MDFEFDPAKSQSNKAKHGIDFIEAQALWESVTVEVQARNAPEEERRRVTGKIEDKFWSAIITRRGEAIRLISVRRARDNEIRFYEYQTADQP
jgi:uncharacterized DUF497 family protein